MGDRDGSTVLRVLDRRGVGAEALATHDWNVHQQWRQDTTGAICAHVMSADHSRSIFVKVDESAPSGWSERLHDLYVLLDGVHDPGPRITPRPVAWTDDPPAICYEWMVGQRLKHACAELFAQGRVDAVEMLSRSVGVSLRDLHSLWARAVPSDGDRPRISRRLVVVGWFCGTPSSRWHRHVVRTPADLGPWNIIAGPDRVGFIDLDEGVIRPLEAELGSLLHRVQVMLIKEARWHGGRTKRQQGRLAVRIAREVARGYDDHEDAHAPRQVDLSLVHAAAAVDAATVGASRARAIRTPADLRGVLRKLRLALVHVGHAWLIRILPTAR